MKRKTVMRIEELALPVNPIGPLGLYKNLFLTMNDVINAFVYVLYLEKTQITWQQLEKTLKKVIETDEEIKKENPYEIFIVFQDCFSPGAGVDGASRWESYFAWMPAHLGLSMGRRMRRSRDISIFEAHDWPEFKKHIETHSIRKITREDLPKIFEIAENLLTAIKEETKNES